jgi:threonine dehydrogenase-like Zn-dependent dehydrogenase
MSRTKIALIVAPGAVLLIAACSTAPAKTTTSTTQPAAPAATTSTSPPAAAATTSTALSGTWNGQYSGSYNGTFKLTWQQSNSTLSGSIDVSSLGGSVAINGTVNGSSIQFGTLGSTQITYTGSVSGSSMSGSWQIANGGGNGSWSASKA